MKSQEKNHQLQVKVHADKSVIPSGKAVTRIVEINLIAPPAPGDKPHLPLNLALVLDRSGSMHGDKLHYVKEAALHVVDLMTAQDRLALVIYDDKVETLMPSQFLTQAVKNKLKAKIQRIESGGSTFLYGGWVTGSRHVAEALSDSSFNRTLLLTDGLANVGVRDLGTLSMHAQELFQRGISSSCFGVGQDYDEHLLEAMANLGGGNFHFLETVQAIPLVFEREFEEIVNIVLKDVQVTLTLSESVQATVSANWHTKREGDHLDIFLGSLVADQAQPLYLQLVGLDGSKHTHLAIPLTVTGKDHDQASFEIKTALTFQALPEAEEAALPQDPDLMGRFAVVDLADKADQALQRERAGDRVGSSQMMRNVLKNNLDFITQDTFNKYDKISNQMLMGMDETERKRRHFQSYQTKRGIQSIRDFRLRFQHGALLAEIEGLTVLIDTAAPTSISRTPEWLFLDELHTLPQEQKGVTCEERSIALGTRVDVVLGMDLLRSLYLRLDPDRGLITFSRSPLRARGYRLSLDGNGVPPTCKLTVAGVELDMRLMTAARLSYVPEHLAQGYQPIGEEKSALPGQPEVPTPVYDLPASLGQTIPLACGLLPPDDKGEGILGASFFQSVPATLAFPNWELVVLI